VCSPSSRECQTLENAKECTVRPQESGCEEQVGVRGWGRRGVGVGEGGGEEWEGVSIGPAVFKKAESLCEHRGGDVCVGVYTLKTHQIEHLHISLSSISYTSIQLLN
jgi:hypothetical protein